MAVQLITRRVQEAKPISITEITMLIGICEARPMDQRHASPMQRPSFY